MKKIFFFIPTGEYLFSGTVTRYYFKKTDYYSLYLKHIKYHKMHFFLSRMLDFSNIGGPLVSGWVLIGICAIDYTEIFDTAAIIQFFVSEQLSSYHYMKAMYYYNKKDEYTLEYTVTEKYLASTLVEKRTEYE